MRVYEEVKQALQDIVAPELKSLQIEIRRLDEKIDSGFARLSDKGDSLRAELLSEIKRLDEKIDIAIQIRKGLHLLKHGWLLWGDRGHKSI